MVVALVSVGGGVAAADPVDVAEVNRSVDTVDGYHLSASLTKMTINSVPNMAATAFTREGFITATVTATVDDNGNAPVNTVKLKLFAQVGCQIELTQGATLLFGTEGSGAAADLVAGNPAGRFSPGINVTLLPGYIQEILITEKEMKADLNHFSVKDLAGHQFEISVDDYEVKVDKCGGPVSVRLGATAYMSTDNSDKTVTLYGDILPL
jgi:hypothetical protein